MDCIHEITLHTLVGLPDSSAQKQQASKDERSSAQDRRENKQIVADADTAVRDLTAVIDALRIDDGYVPSRGSIAECALDYLRCRIQLKDELDGREPVPKCMRSCFGYRFPGDAAEDSELISLPPIPSLASDSSESSSDEAAEELDGGEETGGLGDTYGEDFLLGNFPNCGEPDGDERID